MENALVETSKNDSESVVRYDGGLSSWSPDELRAMVAQEVELRTIVVDYYRSQMLSGQHFYTLKGSKKPALSKEGALNLCSLFKVRVAAAEPFETYHRDDHYTVRYRVHLTSMRSGEVVADGEGSCSTRESKYAYRWVKPSDVPAYLDRETLAKRSGQYGTQYRINNIDLADHYNTVLKMAFKRAVVAAALCLPLVSELFTQDLEEGHIRHAAFGNDESPRYGSNNRSSRQQSVPAQRRSGLVQAWNAETQQWEEGPAKQASDDAMARLRAERDEPEYDESDDIPDVTQSDPMTEPQRMKLLGMLKQLGVRDGDKRELLTLLNLDKYSASALIDKIATDGADKFPWQVLSVYIGMLRDRTGKTNEDIADYCSSEHNERHPANLSRNGRIALFEWLDGFTILEGEEEEEVDDMAAWIEAAHVSSEMLAKMSNDEIQRAITNWKKRQGALASQS